MKERPILFSAPMVRAILAGTKTQTRRVVKPQPEVREITQVGHMLGFKRHRGDGFWLWPNARERIVAECPYGQPGDRLWVRETWSTNFGNEGGYLYRADHGGAASYHRACLKTGVWTHYTEQWRPSIHMPRHASRITLEIAEVRMQRLQDISEADAIAEGIERSCVPGHFKDYLNHPYDVPAGLTACSACESFETLWESIQGDGAWEANPWVWAVSFKPVPVGEKETA